jgi:hypothetical protein
MTIRVEIKCIVKDDRKARHECIQKVGGTNPDGRNWSLTEAQAIAGIENKEYDFYTRGGGQVADVIIATHNGKKYLKTKADTTTKDNLLSLPKCPG